MKLWWSKRVGDVEETFEIEAETAGEVIVVYQAVVDYETKPEGKNETSNLNTGNGTDPGNTGNS